MTVRELIEKLASLPAEAEVRITVPTNSKKKMNIPATDVTFDEFGPLLYVEVV